MKHIPTRFIAFAFTLAAAGSLPAQDIICPSTACGNLNVNFNNAGEVVFCEGSTITLMNESAVGFDFFIFDWGDGAIDTLYNYNDAQHEYDIPDSLVCERPQTAFSVSFTGIALCAEGNSCQSGSYTFGIKPEPLARFSVPSTLCVNTPFTPLDASCHALGHEWDFGDGGTSGLPNPGYQYDTPGTYEITLTVSNTCGSDTYTEEVEVVGPPAAAFTQSSDGGCANSIVDFADGSNIFSNTSWSITPDGDANWCFTDTLMNHSSDNISVLFKQALTYTVTLTASNVCGQDVETVQLTFAEAPVVGLNAPPPACNSITITEADLGFSIMGAYNQITWDFENGSIGGATGPVFGPVTFTESGAVHLTVTGDCGDLERSVDVVVSQSEDIAITQPAVYCSGSDPDTLQFSPGGGTWSGTGVSEAGVFDPSVGAGTYVLTYRLNNAPCNDEATVTVTVEDSEAVATTSRFFCTDSPADDLQATPGGGTWSGDGITNPDNGTFNPVETGNGVFHPVYTYTDGNGCVVTSSPAITVEAPPQLALPDTVPLCLTDADVDLQMSINISADSTGGTFSWAGPGVINPDGTFNASVGNLDEGAYTLMVAYERNECTVSDSLAVVLAEAEPLAIDPVEPVCISQETLQLNVNLPGGSWSGPGEPTNDGVVDLLEAGGGLHTFTYLYAAGTSCEQEASVIVEVIDLEQVVSAGNPEAACEGEATHILSGGIPIGGQWSGPEIMNPDSGSINLTQLTPGQQYQYFYCIESEEVEGCSACATKTLTYNPKPEAGFSFEGAPCINTTFTLIPDQPGLSYEWDFGDGNGSTDENPTHEYATSDTFTLTQIIRTTEGCTDTASQDLYITSPPTADFELLNDEGCAPFTLELENHSFGDGITQQWCIDGDTIDGAAPPTFVFDSLADDTFFPIILKVANMCGTRIDSDSVLVHPYPLVNFGISEDEGCSPFRPEIRNVTQGKPDTFLWLLNGVPLSSDSIPDLPELTTPDSSVTVYTLQLIAGNACGERSLSKEITVYPPDVEAFIELDTLEGCQPLTLYPESFSTPGSILSWEVHGPQGQYDGGAGNRPELELPDPGLYTIVLHASRCGTDSDTAQVEVLPAPAVGFVHEPSACLGDTIRFQNTSSNVGGSYWQFGDGDTSTAFSPVHTYDTAGVFTVTYTGQSLINNCPASDSSTVTVYGLPQSAFSPAITAGCPPLEVAFTNQSAGAGNLNYSWYFDDGTNFSMETNPTHTFMESGVYRVKLVTYDDAGCFSDTATALITVHPKPASAFELSQESYCIGYDTIRVAGQSAGAVSWEWEIGGTEYTGPNPIAIPEVPGQYTARLAVENSFGCRDTSSLPYEVLASPISEFTPTPAATCAGEAISFQNQSAFADSYLWNFGDGTGSTQTSPSRVFEAAGTYTISLTATSTNGCPEAIAVDTITVHPNPIASFTLNQPEACGAPVEVLFTNNSTGNLENGWSFGDNKVSSELHPSHIYDRPREYQIRLITTTEFGCVDTAYQMVDVYGNPVAEAGISQRRVCAGAQVTLTAVPTEVIRYEWYLLPSLQPDTGRVVSYTPAKPGEYDIRLVAIYNEQCRDTLDWRGAFTAFEQPIADFDFVADELDGPIGDVRFINLSENATDFIWNLGDGTFSTEFEPTHEYDINRDVEVHLTASTTNEGRFFCSDTIAKPVQPEWIASFEVPNAFSPDYGDPAVREFGAVGSGVAEYSLQVYSPYGTIVWNTSELEEGHPTGRWAGHYRNKPAPQGAYTWQAWVKFVNGNEVFKKGTVTILR